MKFNSILIFFLALLFLNNQSSAERIGLSDESWKRIRTEHFDIIFTAKQQDLGLYYANQAEFAFENLSTVFTNRPKKIVMILNDTTDISNGYATRIPYAHIMVYTAPIGDHESLSESGEWARELITHEMTHILQFEPALSFYKFLRPLFGTIVAPNLLMPLWWKEGMAVEMETQFSPQGRSRSYFQDASLRAFVLDKKLFEYKLPQANEVLPSWPYGSRAYLFGSVFWSSFAQDTKISNVDTIVTRQGERVPYAVEEPMREIVNRTYEGQYTKALNEVEINANLQIEKLKQQEISNIQTLKTQGESSFNPNWSNEFKILALIEQVESDHEIKFFNDQREELKLKHRPSGKLSSLQFHPYAKKVLYAKVEDLNSKYKVSDLYMYDLETEKSEQVTFNQRAREASFSDDGKKIVFVSTFDGKTQIKTFDFETKKIKTILSGDFKNRYQSPIFWTQNKILYSKRNASGQQKLYSYQLDHEQENLINLNLADIRFLRKKIINSTPTLFFTSSENGVHNIYSSADLKKAIPVSHVATGLWSYDIDPTQKQIWASQMTSSGFQVGSLELKNRQQKLPAIQNKLAERYDYKEKKQTEKNYTPEDYPAAGYLIPTYWIPFIATSSSSRGMYLQAQTSGHDPINIHDYSLQANYDTELQKGGFTGYYTNSATNLPFQISGVVQSKSLGEASNLVETKTGSFGLTPDLFWLSKNLTFQIGVQHQQTDYFGNQTQHWGSYLLANYIDFTQNIFQISPDHGWGAYLKYENLQNIKNSRDYNKVMASVIAYFSPWLPTHHAIMTRVSTLLTFESIQSRFGASNTSLFYNSDTTLPQFVLRGYQPSQFYGRSMWNANLEYRFPVKKIEKGSGTDAYFLKRVSGALVTDGLGVEGGSITEKNAFEKRTINESFWSSGAELKLETTIGYVLPVNFVLGLYVPYSPLFSSSTQIGISLQIAGF
jgi:hypothetical protein